jgi:C4-type Zn-finger protein
MNQHPDITRVLCPVCGNEIHTVVAVPPWAAGMAFVTEICDRCAETMNIEIEVEK